MIKTQNQELCLKFLNWLSVSRSPETVQSYRWAIKVLSDWCDGMEYEITGLSRENIVDFTLYLRDDRQVKSSTQQSYLGAMRTMWHWLYINKTVEFDESAIQVPKQREINHYPFILEQEFKAMMNTCSDYFPDGCRNKAILAFLNATGLRLSEMLAVDVSQIDLTNKKGVARTFKRINHYREIYWDDDTNYYLARWLECRKEIIAKININTNSLFICLGSSHIGKPMGRHAVQKMIRHCRKVAGVRRKITCHSFRHGFGYRAVEKGVHSRHLQIMLGHAKLENTMVYMGVRDGDVEKAYRMRMVA